MLRRSFLLSLSSLPAVAQPSRDPWSPQESIEPADLRDLLASGKTKPVILYVGFPVLYRAAHIPGALLAGPGSKSEGLASLKSRTAELAKTREIVLYCGCCPFDQCPNIRPAYSALRESGFRHIRVVHIPTNLHTDWVTKGYPVEKSQAANA